MNEHIKAGEQCFRIIREFEKAPPLCPQTEDGAALAAYLCPSGQWTIGFGCCFWPDGKPVRDGDRLGHENVHKLLAYNLRYCEDYVREHVAVELDQYQFDALVSFRFNTRETTLRNSTRLLPAINAREWQKAAVAITEFIYGTSTYDGKPYQRALRGLLRRRLWEALIFLGYDPAEAVKDDDVALPSDRIQLASGVYRDVIRSEGVTTLSQVRMKATRLPPPDLVPDTPITTFRDAAAQVNALPEIKADPPAPELDGKAESPEESPNPPPATSAHVNEPAISLDDAPVVSKNPPDLNTKPAASPAGPAEEGGVPRSPPPPVSTKPPDVAKNPIGSKTIWGGLLTALAPELEKIGNTLLGLGQTMGAPILTLGIIMIVLGRIGAVQPLSVAAPIRSNR